jgi:membrane protein implicated in regulation of membrane protease activity
MILKLSIKVLFVAIEISLAVYSFVLSDSLLVKFLFFATTAVIIAFFVTKITNKLLPGDKDYISLEEDKKQE